MYLVKRLTKFIVNTGKKLFIKDESALIYKFLIIGDKEVGKTSFINKALDDTFDLEIPSTSDIEYHNMEFTLGFNKINIILVDLATSQLSKKHAYFFNDINGAFILYDITKYETFKKVQTYICDIQSLGLNTPLIVVGNKTDLKNLRQVHEKELKDLACQFNCDHCETTCTSGTSVIDIVKFMVFKSYYNSLNNEEKEEILKML